MNNIKNTLIFIHIPKAGGSTLATIINRNFSQDEIFGVRVAEIEKIYKNKDSFAAKIAERKGKIRFFSGHVPYGVHQYFSSPCDYINVLRHPVDRIISEYYYILKSRKHECHLAMKNKTLKEYVSSNMDIVSNYQTRLLSGRWAVLCGVSELSKNALREAKNNLRKYFKIVGILERFDETLLVLKKSFGWKNIYYTKKNVTKDRHNKIYLSKDEIPEDIISIIRRNNVMDLELYSFANHLLDESIKNYGTSFSDDLSIFKRRNKIYWIIVYIFTLIWERTTKRIIRKFLKIFCKIKKYVLL